MGWVFANLFLLAIVLVGAGYTWLALWLLKLMHLNETLLAVLILLTAALVATYFTMKYVYRWISKRI